MKRTLTLVIAIATVVALLFYLLLYPKLEIIAGYNAKLLCSCIFVSGLTQAEAESVELGFGPLWLASNKVDTEARRVESHVWGFHRKVAQYREGQGCFVIDKRQFNAELARSHNPRLGWDWYEDAYPKVPVSGSPAMMRALQSGFDAPGEKKLQTRAIVVLKDGELVGEAYADGIHADTPLLGWSMAKSVTALLAGLLYSDGYWTQSSPLNLPEWQGDGRKDITLGHAVQMTTGLDWEENYGDVSNATIMLYRERAMGQYAASVPLAHTPGSEWKYSSGTSNILAYALRGAFKTNEAYLNFPYECLFAPMGAQSFLIETDASGHFVGSSYAYASGRDWAKMGQLCLDYGYWRGAPLVDSAWVAQVTTATEISGGTYGGHFWTNAAGRYQEMAPTDFWMDGFQGQQVLVLRSEGLVIARLGVTYQEEHFDVDALLRAIKAALAADGGKP
jgi:CubicO group peptidase (beta-lactamase class C family)